MDTTKKEEDATSVQRSELDAITAALRENTVALVEMGVVVARICNQINQIINKGVRIG